MLNQEITSPVFGKGRYKNPGTEYQFLEFSDEGKHSIRIWADGSVTLGGYLSCVETTVDELPMIASEAKRLWEVMR